MQCRLSAIVALVVLASLMVNAQVQYPIPLVPAGTGYPPISEPASFAWPPKYSPAVEPVNPRSLAGLNIVITGDSTKWGQGNTLARLLKAEGANVYGFSRTKTNKVFNCSWDHYSGDLTKEAQVKSFVKWLKRQGVTRVDAAFLNSGAMMNLYPQDLTPENLREGCMEVNFFGNYGMYYHLLEAGLLPVNGDIRIIWTGSVGESTVFTPIMSYGISKAAINNFVKQNAVAEKLHGLGLKHFVLNPYVVSTQIRCHNLQPVKADELCGEYTQAMYDSSQDTICKNDFVPNQAMTTAEDVARFHIASLRDPNPRYRISLIESAAPLDSVGGKWDRWYGLWYNANPIEFAQEWLGSVFRNYFPSCAVFHA